LPLWVRNSAKRSMDILAQDFRLALRQLARNRAFAITAIATLTVGIGATTSVFSLVNGVLLNPLGFFRPDRLVYLGATDPNGAPEEISPQDLRDFQSQTHSFASIAAVDAGESLNLTRASSAALRVRGARVGASFFDILGVAPERGRAFMSGEDAKVAPKVVVLSDAVWRREFGADQRVVGQTITLNGNGYEVIGIAPPRFTFPGSPDLWYPAVWRDWELGDTARGYHTIHAIARLAKGATLASAQRDLATVAARIARDFPKYDAKVGATAAPLRDEIVGDVERPLWMLFGAVAFVLLIACVNIGNLLLVRVSERQSEIAVRSALGAGRGRLVRQLVTESLVLAAIGAVLGVLVAAWSLEALARFGPSNLPRLAEVSVDGRVLAFAIGLALVAGVGFGILPALYASRADLSGMLRAGARGLAGGANRARSTLLVAELAFGTTLLVGAGLLVRSFQRLVHVNPGFRAEQVIVFDAATSGSRYEYDAANIAFADQVLARLAALPGTTGTAVAANRPFDVDPQFSASTSFTVDGEARPAPGSEPESRLLPVSPGYFGALGMTLLRGRTFTDAENRIDAAPVVVINDALATRYFAGQNPIGKHITFGIRHSVSAAPNDTVRARGEIIGVVHTTQHTSLSGKPEPATYLPFRVLPFGPSFVVRTSADPATVEREIRAQVAAVDHDVPIYELESLSDALGASVSRPRFYMLVCTAFSLVGLLLAAIGIYGVVSQTVTQRTREYGIRIALGATVDQVVRRIVRRSAWLTAGGLALGLVGAAVATRTMRGLLFGIAPTDPAAFALACVVLGGTALVAAWLAARRVGGVDPVVAMRAE
jgi:putative ABC transport system permease protein